MSKLTLAEKKIIRAWTSLPDGDKVKRLSAWASFWFGAEAVDKATKETKNAD